MRTAVNTTNDISDDSTCALSGKGAVYTKHSLEVRASDVREVSNDHKKNEGSIEMDLSVPKDLK